jgi:hypothetical protein
MEDGVGHENVVEPNEVFVIVGLVVFHLPVGARYILADDALQAKVGKRQRVSQRDGHTV